MFERQTILLLGGYGVFGTRIARRLGLEDDIALIIAGRSQERAEQKVAELRAENPNLVAQAVAVDIYADLTACLARSKPKVVIHLCGPFQGQDYTVAEACIDQGCHYIDLSDSRVFVQDFPQLNAQAKRRGVTLISGASSVPGLSSAVIGHFASEFSVLNEIDMGIAPGFKTVRGIATMQAVMGYVGKPIPVWQDGQWQTVYGWLDSHYEYYPDMGRRYMANCDIPDLALFPEFFQVRESVRFYAGIELAWMHGGLTWLARLVKAGVINNVARYASVLSKVSNFFLCFGSGTGGMHIRLRGEDAQGAAIERCWYILADTDDGPQIPCTASVLLAKKLARDTFVKTGAMACLNLFAIDEFMHELRDFNIWTITKSD